MFLVRGWSTIFDLPHAFFFKRNGNSDGLLCAAYELREEIESKLRALHF